ncbi:type VI secretion system baseplate subunit TssG [Amantichitinum ursilacus]|uniref:Type VI secretion protein n=1 Tax=Amantichitinum ursilacus TaxID=857265 RepID=A0A0N0GNK0_9NEIS|nr:type VI secretion system baseplate subunit TssG [Amantichitinum ursilacus]KPC52613.1 hypothetical protein WG78_12235 [Amantichitinum ursilacus]
MNVTLPVPPSFDGRDLTELPSARARPFSTDQTVPGEGLVPAILRRAPLFNFYQLCELLDSAQAQRPALGTQDTPAHEPVRFRPHTALGFPAAELGRAEADPDNLAAPPTVRTRFLGLYGVDARMPFHVLDDIATRREGHEALAAFLDLFNHRIITLYYRIWRKYRYPVGFVAGAADPTSQALLSLVGLGMGQSQHRPDLPVARFMGLLGLGGQRTRTAEGLAAVVRLLRPDARVMVDEFFAVARVLEQPATLGQAPVALRTGALVLGRSVIDRNSTVRVVIRLDAAADIATLLPGGQQHTDLLQMLKVYLGYKLDAEIILRIDVAALPPMRLGCAPLRLGLTTMAGRPAQGTLVDIRLGRYCGFATSRAHH